MMTVVYSCSLDIWNDVVLTSHQQLVRLYWCVFLNLKLLFVFDVVCRYSIRPQSHTDVLCEYTTISITVVCLCSWNGVVLALDDQTVCLHWCVLEFETVICL